MADKSSEQTKGGWQTEVLLPSDTAESKPRLGGDQLVRGSAGAVSDQQASSLQQLFGKRQELEKALSPEVQDKIEDLRITLATEPNLTSKVQIGRVMRDYISKQAPALAANLASADSILHRMGSSNRAADLKRQNDSFLDPYSRLVGLGSKEGLKVDFGNEGEDTGKLKPFVRLDKPFGVISEFSDQKYYLKNPTQPEAELKELKRFANLANQFPALAEKYGLNLKISDGEKGPKIELGFLVDDKAINPNFDLDKPIGPQVEEYVRDLKKDIQTNHKVELATPGSTVMYRGRATSMKVVEPSPTQLLVLKQALEKFTGADAGASVRVSFADFPGQGIAESNPQRPQIILSTRVSTARNPEIGASHLEGVVLHELGHLDKDSKAGVELDRKIAATYGMTSTAEGLGMITGPDGSTFCFDGYKDNEDPSKLELNLDLWRKNCPTNALTRAFSTEVDRAQLVSAFAKEPPSKYFWNTHELTVEVGTHFQVSEFARANLLNKNPQAYEILKAYDQARIDAKFPAKPGGLGAMRASNGRIVEASAENIARLKEWEIAQRK